VIFIGLDTSYENNQTFCLFVRTPSRLRMYITLNTYDCFADKGITNVSPSISSILVFTSEIKDCQIWFSTSEKWP
jgi:hypothetical protein